MSDKVKKFINYLVMFLMVISAGFFTGRSTVKPKIIEIIKYEKGDTVTISKDSLVPVYIKKPIDTTNVLLAAIQSGKFTDLFPVKDSIVYVTKEDTTAALLDWASLRIYEEKLFDIDTVGTETVKLEVQYNRLQSINGTFVPVIKHIETTQEIAKKFAPFVGCGITTAPELVLNGGVFLDDKYGVSLMYEYDWKLKRNNVGMTVLYKF